MTIEIILSSLSGLGLGALLFWGFVVLKKRGFQGIADKIVAQAEESIQKKKQQCDLDLKEKELQFERALDTQKKKDREAIIRDEERLKAKEEKLELRSSQLEKKYTDAEKRDSEFEKKQQTIRDEEARLQQEKKKLIQELESLSKLSQNEAKNELLRTLESEITVERSLFIKNKLLETEREVNSKAARIIVGAINRMAASTTSEATISTVPIHSEEIKGRIIGKEGRNIRTLEKATGATFLMDDTPQTIVVSCFDPVRRAIAKNALIDLISDGRIHPTRIEEAVEKAKKQIETEIHQFGQDAAVRAKCPNLHHELMLLLGKLKYRYSLGQNVLEHSLEVSHLMGLMASELGLNASLARRIGLLHDIGKSCTHEIQGTHALIGRDLALKYGESAEVANGIGCHHNEIEATTLEGSLCSAADAISASRPGARIDALDEYIQRLHRLEEIAKEFEGVESAYALQAGREIRILVKPDLVQDEELLPLARTLTKKIETELVYPGKIKVSLFREKRVVDYAM
ncbi:MAG: ribonuclease Y [Parachlamydiaceae bacterium]